MQTKTCFSNKNWLDYFIKLWLPINNISMWSWFSGSLKKTESTAGWFSCVFGLRLVCVCQRNVLHFQSVWSCDVSTGLVQRTHSLSEQGILFPVTQSKKKWLSLCYKCKWPLLHIVFSRDFKNLPFPQVTHGKFTSDLVEDFKNSARRWRRRGSEGDVELADSATGG